MNNLSSISQFQDTGVARHSFQVKTQISKFIAKSRVLDPTSQNSGKGFVLTVNAESGDYFEDGEI